MKIKKFTESLKEPDNIEPIFYTKYQKLDGEINSKIYDLVEKYGEESEFMNDKVLKVTDKDYSFNVGSGYIVEVYKENLITNDGMFFSFYSISMENLCSLVDYLIAKYEK